MTTVAEALHRTAPQLLTVKQLQQFIPADKTTIYAWVKTRGLPAVKLGQRFMFDGAKVAAWLRERETTV
jgi:excisionase family DNA binding protein